MMLFGICVILGSPPPLTTPSTHPLRDYAFMSAGPGPSWRLAPCGRRGPWKWTDQRQQRQLWVRIRYMFKTRYSLLDMQLSWRF